MHIEQTHSLGIEEARIRLRSLGDYLAMKHGVTVEWLDENRARIQGKYAVVSIDVEVLIEAHRVQVTGKDPGTLWRMPAKKYVEGKLTSYLGPVPPVI